MFGVWGFSGEVIEDSKGCQIFSWYSSPEKTRREGIRALSGSSEQEKEGEAYQRGQRGIRRVVVLFQPLFTESLLRGVV